MSFHSNSHIYSQLPFPATHTKKSKSKLIEIDLVKIKMSRGRGLALLNKIKERQQEEIERQQEEIGKREKEAFLNSLKERKKALEGKFNAGRIKT